eukprot:gene12570-biopygen889
MPNGTNLRRGQRQRGRQARRRRRRGQQRVPGTRTETGPRHGASRRGVSSSPSQRPRHTDTKSYRRKMRIHNVTDAGNGNHWHRG